MNHIAYVIGFSFSHSNIIFFKPLPVLSYKSHYKQKLDVGPLTHMPLTHIHLMVFQKSKQLPTVTPVKHVLYVKDKIKIQRRTVHSR